MPQIKPEVEVFARIKVIGVGGSGKNAVNHMVNSKVKGVEFIAINTDAQDLHHSEAKKKIHIGKNLTRGLGTGMDPELGKKAAEETKEEIQEAIKGSDMVFIACGLGGGSGTGASPIIARTAKELGALTVGVVTKPFSFEGNQRMRIAETGLEELRQSVDALIVIPNDRLLAAIDKETSALNAFAMCDDILKQAVEGISDLITMPGLINIDFADIRAVMEGAGGALMGIGRASGEKRAEEAAKLAINSPLLEVSINGAKGVLFSIAGGDDLTMFEIHDAAKFITESVDPNAKIIFGTVRDEKLKKGELKITVIASGFPDNYMKKKIFEGGEGAEEENKGKIFNSVFGKDKEDKRDEKNNKEIEKERDADKKQNIIDEDDDEWGAVPAFLRRSKLK
ncbi:MAG: Cell division protein ftsZ [Parcubacteria group bacterium GW2011_GWB1_35_5]|uniref:Cell division protein FtsZ n=1 Tax=Candidatus Zambryskibacteria bacterium RIFCSPLOWO2_01_FULL_35_19 TaxID=1802757 RepID=A0A1G2TVS1_9BACT|nr:MAG: Cell division protein ftsZ [Parcubacteria group bacterium GW2011_GWC1_34_10]KKP80028.1 MAG: Cell division protein ftsZ [Parcubacteria group bacterium GW2011_GWB1_35_5]OHA87624.1 MAG: cell division protein FtsZ [Candidatus Zambryskibacteria bacterium RIFCSPHIGHO2_01_FULL_35_32]OHB01249.1 MAG: cell division protein FtsZ [Candidatus Zambryskibacteria bacterium RIFCSPLOWO2_01_FULL_35_19]